MAFTCKECGEAVNLSDDEDMRGGLAFATLVDRSKGILTAIRFGIHLSRSFRKALAEIRLMRKMQNDPTEPPKSALNGEYQLLNGAPENPEPT